MHSLAFGALKPIIDLDSSKCLRQNQVEMTLDVMANSLVYWSQDLFQEQLLQNIKLSGKKLDLSESFFVNAKLFAKGELQRFITLTKSIESHKRHFFFIL